MNGFFWLLCAHYLGDFVLQTNNMAKNKSKSFFVLFVHVLVWSTVILIASLLALPISYRLCFIFVTINFGLHFAIDAVTSRWMAAILFVGKRHEFFMLLGLDQLMHQLCLLVTLYYVSGNRIF
jgi:hypothetical protein